MRKLMGVGACLVAALSVAGLAADQSRGRSGVDPVTGGLATAVVDPSAFGGARASTELRRARSAGATAVRLILFWDQVAPRGQVKPPGFDAADPASPLYSWSWLDRQVRLAAGQGLEPIVGIQSAPAWAERGAGGSPGTRNPNPVELGLFARAAALRYSGEAGGLPRVRYWQVWNEPNLDLFLTPQSPALYRQLVNEFAEAVKGVRADNVVIAGGTAPFGVRTGAVGPLKFMRELLCVSAAARPRPTCSTSIRFDVWSHHPYTMGGPLTHARGRDDVSIGDLPEMRRVLAAAVTARHVVSAGPVRFWVTEFSWDTNPPDPRAVPAALHARWVAEALYRMWRAGVSLVTWFQLRDQPVRTSVFQSGLYYASGRPKPALQAFRFPFVAHRQGKQVLVWGRTPAGRPERVTIERKIGRRWTALLTIRANRYGIFTARLAATRTPYRARLSRGEASRPFTATRTPSIRVAPFGCGGPVPCTQLSPG